MITAFLTAAAVLFLAASFALVIVWHEPEMAWLSSGMASVCVLLVGFASHSKAIIALGAAGIAAWLANSGRPRQRKRIKRVVGDKIRAIRARLTARMRRGAVRPEPSPSPLSPWRWSWRSCRAAARRRWRPTTTLSRHTSR